jgi:hypothetical protein
MRRYTSLRSNIVRRHQLPFRLVSLPYRRWGRGLDKFAHAVALKVQVAARFVTSKVAALATFGCRGRRRVAYSSDATIEGHSWAIGPIVLHSSVLIAFAEYVNRRV